MPLSIDLEKRLYYSLAPSEILIHEHLAEAEDSHSLRPEYHTNYELLSSLSLLPYFARRSQAEGVDLPEILDKERWVEIPRDVADSFGFVSSSYTDYSLLPYARRLSLRPATTERIAPRFRKANEISFHEAPEKTFELVAERRPLLTLALLADLFCPYLSDWAAGHDGWGDHMTVVIGDQVADRLLFWNAQHRYPALTGWDDIPVLRLSADRLASGIPDWLKNWITRRNRRHFGSNHTPHTVLRSCSLNEARLKDIATLLPHNFGAFISTAAHDNSSVFDLQPKGLLHLRRKRSGRWVDQTGVTQGNIKFQNNKFELPLVTPRHIRDNSAASLTDGAWAVALVIERSEDHSKNADRPHVWVWPRRFRLDRSVQIKNYGPRHSLLPNIRPALDGDLIVWDSTAWQRPNLVIPTDIQAFLDALFSYPPSSPERRIAFASEAASKTRYWQVSFSDKARDLLGVFQFFQSLHEALNFLTDTFWLRVIKLLSPEEPASNLKHVNELSQRIHELIKAQSNESLNVELVARRALSMAARSLSAPSEQLKQAGFEKLYAWAIEGKKKKELPDKFHNDLEASVKYLRDREFLWQGFEWRCSFCHHRNWISLDRLLPIVNCEICRKPESSPVATSLHFRLNPFVHHAFGSGSAQGPVIWCLDELARRAERSFIFAPTLEVYRWGSDNPETDIDLLAAVDGLVYLAEVKSSFSGVDSKVIDQLTSLAGDLRPDRVMLAVAKPSTEGEGKIELLNKLRSDIATFDVELELLTLEPTRARHRFHEFASPLGRTMNWSAW